MKRTTLAIALLAVLAGAGSAAAEPMSDQDMASRYFQAAQAGDDDAQFYLASLYSAGVGEPRSDEEAFRWFARAANQGHAHAMLILSGLYAIGRGAPKDNVKAYKWAYIVNSGSKTDEFRNGSRQLIGQLETKMTPSEISQAKSDALSFHAVSTKATPNAAPASAALTKPALTKPASTTPASADDLTRGSLTQPALASTNPTPPTVAAPQPAPVKNRDDQAELTGKARKPDIDDMLDRVPQGLRKRFGF